MPAYIMVFRETPVRDDQRIAEYSSRNRAHAAEFRENFGLKPLVVYGKSEGLEGDNPDGVILLEFPSYADAKAWYESPAYQEALAFRKGAADWRAVIVEGLPG